VTCYFKDATNSEGTIAIEGDATNSNSEFEGTIAIEGGSKDRDMSIEDVYTINNLDENVVINKELYHIEKNINTKNSTNENFTLMTKSLINVTHIGGSLEDAEVSVVRKMMLYFIISHVDNEVYENNNKTYYLDIIEIIKQFIVMIDKKLKENMKYQYAEDERDSVKENGQSK
jgi:hypothetical protein